MNEDRGNSRLVELLQEIQREGGEVKREGGEASALTHDALASVAAQPDFAAWVSWTKSF